MRCWTDRTYFTAYTVKKKGIDYYKCNVDGCKTNVSAKKMHRKFEELLRTYNIPLELVSVFRDVIGNIISTDQKEQKAALSSLKKKKSECEGKMKKCRIKYATDMIDEETFEITMAKLQEDLKAQAKAANAQENWVCRCIERGKENEGPKFWKFSNSKNSPYAQIMELWNMRYEKNRMHIILLIIYRMIIF